MVVPHGICTEIISAEDLDDGGCPTGMAKMENEHVMHTSLLFPVRTATRAKSMRIKYFHIQVDLGVERSEQHLEASLTCQI